MTICLENLRWGLTSEPAHFIELVEAADTAVTLDVGHAVSSETAHAGATTGAEFARMLAPRIVGAHVYDREDPHHIAPTDLERIGDTLSVLLDETACRWWVIELFSADEIRPTRELLLEFLRTRRRDSSPTAGDELPKGLERWAAARRSCYVILDGAADRQQAALGGRTPLESAETPNLDALATAGSSARMYPIAPGIAPSSQQAHWSLFGYEQASFPGRGYFEALGEGLAPARGDVTLRANLARVEARDGAFEIVERPDPRTGEADLAGVDLDAVIDGVAVTFTFTDHLQGLLTLHPQSAMCLTR